MGEIIMIRILKKSALHIVLLLCLSVSLTGQGVKVIGPADLVFAGSPFMVIRDGGLRVSGGYHNANETVIFSGTVASSIMGNTLQMYNLAVTNSGGIFNSVSLLTLNNLSIGATGLFTIADISAVTVSGALSNLGTTSSLLVKSTANGAGSLITSTDGAPLTVERYMAANQWHIVSPAASGIDLPAFLADVANGIPLSGTSYAMTQYNEAEGGWEEYFNASSTGSLTPGEAYLLRRGNNGTIEFKGNSKGSYTQVSIIRSRNGWNGVGNPFSSSIKVRGDVPGADNFLGVNASALDPSYAALYIYDPATPAYYKIINNSASAGRYIAQDYLQAGQGFLVKSALGGGTISFTHGMKYHQSANPFYKKTTKESDWFPLDIEITAAGKKANTLLLLNERMTKGLDVTYDAGLMGGDDSFRTYTRLVEDNGVNFAIQCLPCFYPGQISIPVGVDFKTGGDITLTLRSDRKPEGYIYILEDRKTGTFYSMEPPASVYKTTMEPNSTGADRFLLHIQDESFISQRTADISAPQLSIFNDRKIIYIDGITDSHATAEIIDLSGRIRARFTPEPNTKYLANLDYLPNGYYVIRIRETGKVFTRKLILSE